MDQKSEKVTVRMTRDDQRAVRCEANRRGVSMNRLIETQLAGWLKRLPRAPQSN